jgi:Co/Zn/Cd efflux system component
VACECWKAEVKTEGERQSLKAALAFNAVMFVVGVTAGLWAQSTGVLADSLDMLADAIGYGLALSAASRGPAVKRVAASWSGWILTTLGIGIVADIARAGSSTAANQWVWP